MNKIRIALIALAFCRIASVSAQIDPAFQLPYMNNYDAGIISTTDLNGTARFMGVGGAMGALGGDASVLLYNPAGIGIYRSSEITLSVNGNWNNLDMNSTRATDGDFNLQNAAYIGSWNFKRERGLVNFNVGVAFNRMKNFNRNGTYRTFGNGYSVTQMMADLAQGQSPDQLNVHNLDNPDVGFLPILGYSTGAIWSVEDGSGQPTSDYISYYDHANNIYRAESENPDAYVPMTMNNYVELRERGYQNEFALSFGGNVSNIFYFGMSFVCNVLDYNIYQTYEEKLSDGSSYDHYSSFNLNGTGFTYKVGVIVKPVNWLRIGGAFHTPTWYAVNTSSHGDMDTYTDLDGISSHEYVDSYAYRSYFASPMKALGSLGFVIGKYCFIGLDYQYENFRGMKISDNMHNENLGMRTMFKDRNTTLDRHTLRMGVEFKPISALALRIGGGYSFPINTESATRIYYDNDIRTDLGYYNTLQSYNVTCGIGYYVGRNAFDLAYVWQVNDAQYHPYSNNIQNHPSGVKVPDAVGMHSIRNQIVFTYSIRF